MANIFIEKSEPLFSDLVNNFQLFQEKYKNKSVPVVNGNRKDFVYGKIDPYKDNSDYTDHPHIDEVLHDIGCGMVWTKTLHWNGNPNRVYICRCPISYLFSSEKSKGGCDRPYWVRDHGEKTCLDNLCTPNSSGEAKGYDSGSAGLLSVFARYSADHRRWQLVKYIGNNRVWMKLLANKGADSEVLIELRFHNPSNSVNAQKEYMSKEAELHTTDAGDRSAQNEEQKFVSNYLAGRKNAGDCFEFLEDMEINYADMMQNHSSRPGVDKWISLSGLQGLKEGEHNGYFKKFGRDNVVAAINSVKYIAKNITHETVINSTPLKCFIIMYYCFTKHGFKGEVSDDNKIEPVFTKESLHSYFCDYFTELRNYSSNSKFQKGKKAVINDIGITRTVKDEAYICAVNFWQPKASIIDWYKEHHQKNKAFSLECCAVDKLLSLCKDRFLKRDMKQYL